MISLAVAVLCVLGILWCKFEDNLIQRIGLGCILIGSVSEYFKPLQAVNLLQWGILVYACGVVWKIRGRHATNQELQYPRIYSQFHCDTTGDQ